MSTFRLLRRLTLAVGCVLVLATAWAALNARHVAACSPMPGFDAVRDADVIVAGRVTTWARLGRQPGLSSDGARITMAVDRVYKGSVSTPFTFEASIGSGSTCDLFDHDPKGTYIVIGATHSTDGMHRSSLLYRFFLGSGPNDPLYESSVGPIAASLGSGEEPTVGADAEAGGSGGDWTRTVLLTVLTVAVLGLLSGVLLLRRRDRLPWR